MKLQFLSIPNELTKFIKEFESDTFAEKITEIEAKAIAHFFLNRWARGGDINRDGNTIDFVADRLGIDGVQIEEILEWYRGGELKEGEINL